MKNWSKVGVLVALAVALGVTSGCMQTVEPGNVGIKISKVGDNRGVSKDSLCAGWVFYLPITTKIVEYPVFNQRVVWSADKTEGKAVDESITFQTRDNVPCNIDVAVNYTLLEAKVPEFYTKFRADKIDTFTHGFMRDMARNSATQIGSEYTFDDINGTKKEEFLSKLNVQLIKSVADYGVNVSGVSLIGAIRVPENLKAAINARVQSIQDAIKSENDLRKMKAEAAKTVATAEGEAAAMRAKSASITPQFMELKKLEIEMERAKKWNGALPVTMLGSGSNTLFSLK